MPAVGFPNPMALLYRRYSDAKHIIAQPPKTEKKSSQAAIVAGARPANPCKSVEHVHAQLLSVDSTWNRAPVRGPRRKTPCQFHIKSPVEFGAFNVRLYSLIELVENIDQLMSHSPQRVSIVAHTSPARMAKFRLRRWTQERPSAFFYQFASLFWPLKCLNLYRLAGASKAGPSNANRRERVHESRQMQNNKTLG